MKKTKKRSARERRILILALLVAGAIVAGSTFAWFTSNDEVTNRLSASANYGVSIAEDFQPPENWIPGQAVNKDVSAVNTGNVDAFVRMWLEGEMSVLAKTSQADSAAAVPTSSTTIAQVVPVTDTKYTAIGLNYYNATSKLYYRELSQAKVENPELNDPDDDADEAGDDENTPATFSEVQAVQAGGYLAYAPSGAQYYYVLEHATSISAYAASDATAKTNFELKEGDIVATKGATLPSLSTGVVAVYIDAGESGLNIDSSDFYPQTEGVYLFRRNIDLVIDLANNNDGVNAKDDYEYSGYYYVPKGSAVLLTTADSTNDHYFALYTDDAGRSDYTIPNGAVTDTTSGDVLVPSQNVVKVQPVAGELKFFNAKETIVENSGLTWTYKTPSGGTPVLTAKYDGASSSDEKDDIIIDVTLANIGTTSEKWTAIPGVASGSSSTTAQQTFYYNNDVEAGDTTTMLVDSVKLSDDTTQYAYLAFDFDLNVFLESIQVTTDENGKEMTTPVNSWDATTTGEPAVAINTGAKPESDDEAKTYTGNEITVVGWTTT